MPGVGVKRAVEVTDETRLREVEFDFAVELTHDERPHIVNLRPYRPFFGFRDCLFVGSFASVGPPWGELVGDIFAC